MKVFSKILKIVAGTLIFIGIVGKILGSFDYVLEYGSTSLPLVDWSLAIILVSMGIVLYGLGYLLTKKFGNIDAPAEGPQPTLDMNNLEFIVTALKKTRKRNLIMGLFLGIFGAIMMILPMTLNEGTGVTIGLEIFGGLCLLIGIFGFVQFNKLRNIEMSEIYKLIMHTPQKITALQIQIISSGFGKIGQAINATIIVDKKMKGILAINETDLELLKQYLAKHNPNLEITKHLSQT